MKQKPSAFSNEVSRMLGLEVVHRVNRFGGYGPESEVIYEGHPSGCPSVLVDSRDGATATFMSNGSVGFSVKMSGVMDVRVLDSHFDPVEKRETGTPSGNVWLALTLGGRRVVASLINPACHMDCPAKRIRIVKLGDPDRAMWFCAWFWPAPGVRLETAVKLSLRMSAKGPVLLREVAVRNTGKKPVTGGLWTNYFLHGTQRFVYNKELWYDVGCPVSLADTVMTARVPYSDVIQIKRLQSVPVNLIAVDATSDYATFVGSTAAYSLFPEAILRGGMLSGGAGRKINRFSTAAIAANQFALKLRSQNEASLKQSLLYVTDSATCAAFRLCAGYADPSYKAMAVAFRKACAGLLKATRADINPSASQAADAQWPAFEVQFPTERAVSEYANSVWTGVKELYENCRAHGAKLADGIELGTRDRGQDMWPKIKEDPARVRADLLHVLSFMYVTHAGPFPVDRPLTLREKLHGMFPRQYPSHWNKRENEVRNDNRPYTDSPLWLVNSLCMYIRETGDISVLFERVKTISLTTPDTPETSGIVGNEKTYVVAEVLREVLACFERHADDSPYGIAQILYGDWCDPIDMFGTSEVGNAKTRGRGRGVQVRLSGHLFLTLVETIDTLGSSRVAAALVEQGILVDISRLQAFADRLRKNIVKVAWEDNGGEKDFPAGFLSCIHEFNLDGSRPDYARGEIGYTLGSLLGRDFDGIKRRELAGQAYALATLLTQRPYLSPVPGAETMIARLLHTVDSQFYDEKLGLVMFTKPIANNAQAVAQCGRMGLVQSGTAENGEYHHCQVMMHRFRMGVPGATDIVWKQFKPMMSALRDESIAGPFETPSTSYVSDKDDPHFGKGMYFGLSGSVDWIVEVIHQVVGLRLNLHDPDQPAVGVDPNLPSTLDHTLCFRRILHVATGPGAFRKVPLQIAIAREGQGNTLVLREVVINGKPSLKAEVASLDGIDRLEIDIICRFV